MKILIIGILVFSGWSALSSYIYVCKIKRLCDEPVTVQTTSVRQKDVIMADTSAKRVEKENTAIPEDILVHFAFDKSDINADAKTEKYFNESKVYLDKNAQARLNVTGFADATGTEDYNQALGLRRAQSIRKYFEVKGLTGSKILIFSRGENDPVDDNSTIAGRANNRRAQITIKN